MAPKGIDAVKGYSTPPDPLGEVFHVNGILIPVDGAGKATLTLPRIGSPAATVGEENERLVSVLAANSNQSA